MYFWVGVDNGLTRLLLVVAFVYVYVTFPVGGCGTFVGWVGSCRVGLVYCDVCWSGYCLLAR